LFYFYTPLPFANFVPSRGAISKDNASFALCPNELHMTVKMHLTIHLATDRARGCASDVYWPYLLLNAKKVKNICQMNYQDVNSSNLKMIEKHASEVNHSRNLAGKA
jgi:hypothetical protein